MSRAFYSYLLSYRRFHCSLLCLPGILVCWLALTTTNWLTTSWFVCRLLSAACGVVPRCYPSAMLFAHRYFGPSLELREGGTRAQRRAVGRCFSFWMPQSVVNSVDCRSACHRLLVLPLQRPRHRARPPRRGPHPVPALEDHSNQKSRVLRGFCQNLRKRWQKPASNPRFDVFGQETRGKPATG